MLIILLTLISIRPFISSHAFPYLNYIYSALFIAFLVGWIIIKKPPLGKIASLKYPLLLFCLALVISVMFSLNKVSAFKELYKYINGLLFFLVVASLAYEDKIRTIRAVVFSAFIVSLLAIYQYLFGFQHLLSYISAEKLTNPFALDLIERRRIFFPFVTPNMLAGYLAMVMPLAFTMKDKIWFIIFLSMALLLTKSLGALLSLFLALTLYFYLQGKLKKRNLILLALILSIIAAVFMIRISAHKEHQQPAFSTVMRLGYWEDTLKIIKAKPFTGVGVGNFNLTQSRYAHNSYLQVWAEMGILGIVSILWLIIAIFKSAFRNARNSLNKNLIYCLITAYTVFLIHNVVDFSFFLPEISLIWWSIAGLLLGSF